MLAMSSSSSCLVMSSPAAAASWRKSAAKASSTSSRSSNSSRIIICSQNVTTAAVASAGSMKNNMGRREYSFVVVPAAILIMSLAAAAAPTIAAEEEDQQEYVKDTREVIEKVRSTVRMEKTDPNVASAVAELRDASNSWVAKYRRDKALLGRASFRDMYSALNAVSGHYISFGPTAPIPAKRKARILEEVDTVEKALLRGR